MSVLLSVQDARGFTLIEVLLVTVIVAVLAGVAMTSLGDRQLQSLRVEGQRLQTTLLWLKEESVFQQTAIGIKVLEQGYQQLAWQPAINQWAVYQDRNATYKLPSYIDIKPQPQNINQQTGRQEEQSLTPSIIFYPYRDYTNFELILSIRDSNHQLLIRGRRFKEIELVSM